jgi:hypothetical protein
MDYNPFLRPWRRPEPNKTAGKGTIETPGEAQNIVWQTRSAAPTAYESDLADALVACFEEGVEELEPLVARLNARGVHAPDGSPWTVASFEREIARLGH